MSNIAIFEGNRAVVLNHKTGKTGSFARALAFATREVRQELAATLYQKWLENGQFRPIVNDILDSGLIPKAAVPYVAGTIPSSGAVSKEMLIGLCVSVDHAVRNKCNKDGQPVVLKGQKAFVYGVVQRIAAVAQGETIEA